MKWCPVPACSVAVAPSATSRGLVHKAPDPVTPKGRPLERRVINAARPVCSRDWAPWGTLLGGSSGFGCRAQRRRGGGGLKLAPPRASRSVSATSCCPTVTLKRLPRRGKHSARQRAPARKEPAQQKPRQNPGGPLRGQQAVLSGASGRQCRAPDCGRISPDARAAGSVLLRRFTRPLSSFYRRFFEPMWSCDGGS